MFYVYVAICYVLFKFILHKYSASTKVLYGCYGCISGLLSSYLFRPKLMGISPITFSEWFTEWLFQGATATILICGTIGLTLGYFVGSIVDVMSGLGHR